MLHIKKYVLLCTHLLNTFFLLNVVQAYEAVNKYRMVDDNAHENRGYQYKTNIHFNFSKCLKETSRILEELWEVREGFPEKLIFKWNL